MNKLILTTLTMLFCAEAQSSTRHPESSANLDDAWRVNLNKLHDSYTNELSAPLVERLKDLVPSYITADRVPASFKGIKKPALNKFVRADKYFNEDLIYKSTYKIRDNEIIYILKNRVDEIRSRGSLACEYKVQLWSDDNNDNSYHDNLLPAKEFIAKKLSLTGETVETFIESKTQLGFSIAGNESGGMSKLLINGRAVSLTVINCNNTQSKDQIIKDLTEWAELLIKANK